MQLQCGCKIKARTCDVVYVDRPTRQKTHPNANVLFCLLFLRFFSAGHGSGFHSWGRYLCCTGVRWVRILSRQIRKCLIDYRTYVADNISYFFAGKLNSPTLLCKVLYCCNILCCRYNILCCNALSCTIHGTLCGCKASDNASLL